MKYIPQTLSLVFLIGLYSCNPASKKQTADSFAKSNLQSNVVYPKNSANGKEQPKDTILIFPEFTIRLHYFEVHGGADGNGKFYYNGDSYEGHSNLDEKKDYWSLNIKTDTEIRYNNNESIKNFKSTVY